MTGARAPRSGAQAYSLALIFVEPRFPNNQRQFVRGLVEAGARVTGIGEVPVEALGQDLHRWLSGYEQVPNVCDESRLYDAVRRVQQRGWVDRLESTVEAHIMTAAKVREACGIPGTSVKTAWLCRDKPSMKDVLREAGIPLAQSTRRRHRPTRPGPLPAASASRSSSSRAAPPAPPAPGGWPTRGSWRR